MRQPDENDLYDYTHGGCYDLALAIHEMTGWPLALEQWEDDIWTPAWNTGMRVEYGTPIRPDHAIVESPAGRLDVHGLDGPTPRPIVAAVRVNDPEVVTNLRWMPLDDDHTRELAEYLVALAGGQV